jgi:transcriptional regulator with XRE-family HTH domain
MEIGTVIKKYRRRRDMTQEALAEYLRVSVSAVSQWESGKTAPDLSLIPAICNLFGISADELLGINLEQKEQRIKDIRDEAGKYSERGYNDEAAEILEKGLAEYPDSYDLMHDLMYARSCDIQHVDEAIRLGHAILDGCTDDDYRISAKQVLCYAYRNKRENEKALAIVKTLPNIHITKEIFLPLLYKGNEAYKWSQILIEKLFDLLGTALNGMNEQLDDGTWAYTPVEMAAIRDKQLALYNILFEDGNYGFYHTRMYNIHCGQANYYAEMGDAERALHHLSAAADHAITFVMTESKCEYTSLLLRGRSGGTLYASDPVNDAQDLINFMSSPVFDSLRSTPAFTAILEKLEPVAGQWKIKE